MAGNCRRVCIAAGRGVPECRLGPSDKQQALESPQINETHCPASVTADWFLHSITLMCQTSSQRVGCPVGS